VGGGSEPAYNLREGCAPFSFRALPIPEVIR
jgi:hypothetical protein